MKFTNHAKRLGLLFGILFYLISCKNDNASTNKLEGQEEKQIASEGNRTIIPNQKVGLITSSTSIEDLIEFYGKENIKDAVVFSYEGIDIKGTEIIFEDEVDNITVEWENENKTTPKYIRIENENSNWRTMDDIRIGSAISEVERANGKPFIIRGYEIDHYLKGTVKSWESGKLHQQLGLQFKITEKLPKADYMQIMGSKGIISNNPILLKACLKVERMIIGFSD